MALRANKPEASEVAAWIQDVIQAFANRRDHNPRPPEGVGRGRLAAVAEPWELLWMGVGGKLRIHLLAGKPHAGEHVLIEDGVWVQSVPIALAYTLYDVIDLLNHTLHNRKIPYRLVTGLGNQIDERYFQMLLSGDAL